MTDLIGRRPVLTGLIIVMLLTGGLVVAGTAIGGGGSVRAAASPLLTTTTSTTTSTTTTTTTLPPDTTPPPPDAEPEAPAAAPAAPRAAAPRTAPPATQPPPPDPPAPAGGYDYGAASSIVGWMNAQRTNAGLGPLAADGCLTGLAQGWAKTMGDRQSMSHNPGFASCNGTAGENVGMWSPCSTSGVENWWMNSSGHRANILNPNYGSTGVGVWIDGNGACWYAVDFGP